MTPIETRLRRYLLLLAAAVCGGTPVELWFIDKYHAGEPIQLVPYVLCALGLVALVALLVRPSRVTVLAARGVMALLLVGSLVGIFEHIQTNYEGEAEMRPNAPVSEVLPKALRGAAPLGAPAVLAMAGALGLGATMAHPELERRKEAVRRAASPT